MNGKYKISVISKRLRFDFELRRNITVLKGDSASGKTTLVDMIAEHSADPTGSPVQVISEKQCYAVSGALWVEQIRGIHDSFVFIDEGNRFVCSSDFARVIQGTDNYYVLVTRESLPNLPYSVEEVYGIRTSGKYGGLKQYYSEFYRIYNFSFESMKKVDILITEDSNAGNSFFCGICDKAGIRCMSAGGKSNIFALLKSLEKKTILVIADGAAFGAEMERNLRLAESMECTMFYMPESFEWLILKSGLVDGNRVQEILEHPEDYIESEKYFSWERFFTALLIKETAGNYLQYSKSELSTVYLRDKEMTAIIKAMDQAAVLLGYSSSARMR